MATFLFLMICIIYIGLGLPDSILGSAWPSIYSDLNLPISYANFITFLISFGTVTASFFSARLINKVGTGALTSISTVLTTLCLLAFSFSNSILFFCLLAIPLGFGAGAIDAALNNYVAVRYSPKHMSFLHCFYGIGVSLSPFLMSFALSLTQSWRQGYRLVFLLMVVISIISIFILPVWKKIKNNSIKDNSDFTPITLSLKQMFKMPAIRTAVLVFFFSVALEFTCGIWSCTYLVKTQNLTESTASRYLTFFYAGITIGRFVSGLISKKIKMEAIVYIGYFIIGTAILLLFLPLPPIFKAISLFFIGFGNGPIFPNLTYLTPIKFGKEISQSVIGIQMTACNLGILVMPPVFGFVAQYLGLHIFPIFLLILFLITLFSTIVYSKQTCAQNKK